jgi:arylsulfatase A-like enzyme
VSPQTFARLGLAATDIRLRAPRELRPLLTRRARLGISTDIFLELCRRHSPDFSAFVTFLVDYAEHRFWMFQEPGLFHDAPKDIPPRLASAVADAYVAVDDALGRILRSLDSQTTIAVISEHGMAPEPVSTEIGPWHFVLKPARLKELTDLDPSTPAVPVARWIALRPPEDQIKNVADRLGAVRVDGIDLPLFQVHLHRDEVIVKLALYRESLGLDELESLKIRYRDRVEPFTWLAEKFGRRRSAMHAEEAIFVVAGPGIRHADLGHHDLVDVAPTLLRAAGIDNLSRRLDGAVLDVFV